MTARHLSLARHVNYKFPDQIRFYLPEGETNHCSKFVVVIGSKPCRTEINGSDPERCICLRNIVKSEIFQTDQKSIWVYESAALTAELQAR